MTYAEQRTNCRAQESRGLWHNLKLALVIGAILLVLVIVEGCGGGGMRATSDPNLSHPAKSLLSTPTVALIGDQTLGSWGANLTPATSNPMWKFYPPSANAPPEISSATLARLPEVLATHPDIVVIDTGIFDLITDPAWDYPAECGVSTTGLCANILQMIVLAHQAGAQVVWCLQPLVQDGTAGTSLIADPARTLPLDLEEWYLYRIPFMQAQPPPPEGADGVVFLFQAVGQTADGRGQKADTAGALDWTQDGLLFDTNGAQLATGATEKVIAGLRGDWGAK